MTAPDQTKPDQTETKPHKKRLAEIDKAIALLQAEQLDIFDTVLQLHDRNLTRAGAELGISRYSMKRRLIRLVAKRQRDRQSDELQPDKLQTGQR